jgi:hypothetical protein
VKRKKKGVPLAIRLARDKAQRDAKRLNGRGHVMLKPHEFEERRAQLGAYMDYLGIRVGSMEQPAESAQ